MEEIFPAPSTALIPLVWLGSRCARPASRTASAGVTPGRNHTSALNPDISSLSKTSSGKTLTLVRSPGATPNSTPASGLSPASSLAKVAASAAVLVATAYGPESHSSPRSGESAGRPLIPAAASTHSAACATVRSRTSSSSSRRRLSGVAAHVFSPMARSSRAWSTAAVSDIAAPSRGRRPHDATLALPYVTGRGGRQNARLSSAELPGRCWSPRRGSCSTAGRTPTCR